MEVGTGDLTLRDGRDTIAIPGCHALLGRAAVLRESSKEPEAPVVVDLRRVDEQVVEEQREASYRERLQQTTRTVVRCLEIEPAPERETWLPKDGPEVQWVIAWTARLAALVAIVLVVSWLSG